MSTEQILAERGKHYGDFSDCARAQQAIKHAIKSGVRYEELPDVIRESLDMIAHKLGRIVTGNPYHADSWQDVIGYAQLVLERIEDGVGLKATQAASEPEEKPLEGLRLDLTKLPYNEGTPFKALEPGRFLVGEIEPPVVPRRDPTHFKPGTPEDGGHHARQDEFEERETLHLSLEDVGKFFKARGGFHVQIVSHSPEANFSFRTTDNKWPLRTARGRVNWQLGAHADDAGDLVERVEALTQEVT